VERAGPVSSQAEVGNIRLHRGPWVGAFLDEVEAFPLGGHDDQVDALSGAMMRLRTSHSPEPLVHQLVGQRRLSMADNPLGLNPDNPIYWDISTPENERYFINADELREKWDNFDRQKKMITIRNNSTPILFEYVRRIGVDDPRVTIREQGKEDIYIFNVT